MAKDLAIVLNNGGINSAVVTALAAQKHRLLMLYAQAGPTQSPRQRASYDRQVTHFKPFREQTLALPTLSSPNPAAEPMADQRGVKGPVGERLIELIPMLSLAIQHAAQFQATAIYLGMRLGSEADSLAQVTEFFQIWNEMIQIPCQLPELEILTPLLELEAWQVVDLGFLVSAPLEKTWSCNHETSEPCWSCRGCRERESAFLRAAKPDPLRITKRT